ncbi:response regulator transcription factor [Thiocapsa roseopersicina]|uniref:Two-component system, OmpR family, response regulator n=1 Tax=Thiocapsa roseopersicina TaxID=1058 RepID=A0A1H3A6M9_THIRO|nr:response regulator transcription factor [Thiocapsa roseopersicina]SDX25400.1 two-component system, OmpR family, response regulator [Thiocapsa roseopersicina]
MSRQPDAPKPIDPPKRVLVVEDDAVGGPQLARFLESFGYRVDLATGEGAARARLAAGRFDAVVLDLTLADGDGYSLLDALRAGDPLLPIICTSGRCDLDARVKGLRSGFDHYLTKPFEPEELEALLARELCRGVHRGAPRGDDRPVPDRERWSIHEGERTLVLDDHLAIPLTETELRFLCLIHRLGPDTVTRSAVIRGLGHSQHYYSDSRLHAVISRLRRKIAQATEQPAPFDSIYGAGYVWTRITRSGGG